MTKTSHQKKFFSGQVEAPKEATSLLYKALCRASHIPASGKTVLENIKEALVDTMPEPVLCWVQSPMKSTMFYWKKNQIFL
jgi:hypothetical protein